MDEGTNNAKIMKGYKGASVTESSERQVAEERYAHLYCNRVI